MKLYSILIIITFFYSIGSLKAAGQKSFDVNGMDQTIKPGTDFFKYTNGNWCKNNPIPPEYSRYGSFDILQEQNYSNIKGLLESAAADKNAKHGSVAQKIGDFYSTGLDIEKIEKDSWNPIKEDLLRIDQVRNFEQFTQIIISLHKKGIFPLFYFGSAQDEMDSEKIIAMIYQGGLGLGDRDYYLGTDKRSTELRTEYKKYIQNMFQLIEISPEAATRASETIINIETQIATGSRTRLELRDPQKNYNKMTLEELSKIIGKFNFHEYFKLFGVAAEAPINVGQPDFIKNLSMAFESIPLQDWIVYVKWHLINSSAGYLNSKFENERFHFYGTVFSGKEKMKDRWKRVLEATSSAMGEAIGQLYVEKYFPPEAKKRMLELVANLKTALAGRINKLEWMGDATKKEALNKLNKINVKIGYPDIWRDYSLLQISKESYLSNVWAANEFEFKRDLEKIGKPVDRSQWDMTPQTVNAYYSPNMNEIVFPAAILQPPYFNLEADDAINYGAIGTVIGHEITHGFDDQGRQYDKDGNMKDWWTENDAKNFKAHTQVIVDQFNTFVAIDTMHVSGELTLGENIADIGGLTVSYNAYMNSIKNKKVENIDGFTPQQRFFLSYANIWKQNIRDKELMKRIKEDVHSPALFRVNGALPNIPYFYEAFNIKQGDKLFLAPDQRAKIW
ncbi:MAG: M13 family peptidase [Candidatus Kapabacteria bacterium]|nr:M13 family peptidase [Candidatus Kapabacteria bacterium]